ncbi:MAG: hypothetical protein KF715_16725 [Candidatus Didemnitutus sp.]|nr:hypothetical protein [Candidatus Didemnitutus sp.]
MKPATKIEFGDFQTPAPLADDACTCLRRLGMKPSRIVEPTCGIGAFLGAATRSFPGVPLHGFEINPDYASHAQTLHAKSVVRVADFFAHDWDAELSADADPLILGNPPWVTNAAVAAVDGANLPAKTNIYGLRGLAAKTGKANFDIAEWMILRLLAARRGRPATLAVLCKTATARKVLRHAWRGHLPITQASLHLIDAAAHFGAAVDACLLVARLGSSGPCAAAVFADLESDVPTHRFGLAGADLVANLGAYERMRAFEGLFPFQWRSGLKHDCASVLELEPDTEDRWRNQAGELVSVEAETIYPWCKSTDLARRSGTPTRAILLPQASLREPADLHLSSAPKALAYLNRHAAAFAARKSSIYRRGGRFAVFGLGEYTFAPWKVAVSSLHRPVKFIVVGPWQSRPVLFDDTCYFLPFATSAEATLVATVLNSRTAMEFMDTLIFPGAKRAVTVELLSRLNFHAIAEAERIVLPATAETAAGNRTQLELLKFG